MSKFLFLYSEPTASNQVSSSTPHGIYDNDTEFQSDSLTTCKYVASKLGHPVMQLEFNSGSKVGDRVTIVGDGSNGWVIVEALGSWAFES